MRDDGTNSFVFRDEPDPMPLSPLECGTRGRGYPMGLPVAGKTSVKRESIVVTVVAFNLVGDGLSDALGVTRRRR